MNLQRLSTATAVVVYYIAAATILTEMFKPVKKAFTAIGGYHWIGKGITAVLLLIIVYLALSKFPNKSADEEMGKGLIYAPIVSGVFMGIFFVVHFLNR